jgi:hypothetical protein
VTASPPAVVSACGYSAVAVLQLQILKLPLRQYSPMPARQIPKPKISKSNTQEIFDAVSDGLEHAPNLPIYSLPQDNAMARRRRGAKPGNLRALTIKKNPAQEFRSLHRIPRSIQRHLIFLFDLETRVGEVLR